MEEFSEIWQFVKSVTSHWLILMSGIVSFLITFWEKIHESHLALRTLYIIGILCIITAFYFAWRNERDKYKPEIRATIDEIIHNANQTENSTDILLFVNVSNMGDQTSLDDWRLEVKLTDGHVYKAEPIIYAPGRIAFNNIKEELDVNDALYIKGMNPIEKGRKIRGFLSFTIPTFVQDALWPGVQIKLLFKDILNREYFAVETIERSKKIDKPKFLPGLLPKHPQK